MSIPSNLCFFPLDTLRLTKISAIFSITLVFTSSSMCDTLLSSTYHNILPFLYLMFLFAMYLLYGLFSNPCDFMVLDYRSYHSSVDSINPYKAFRRRRYSTFTPLSTRKCLLCLGFTSHMMSTNTPSIFYRMNLSSVM